MDNNVASKEFVNYLHVGDFHNASDFLLLNVKGRGGLGFPLLTNEERDEIFKPDTTDKSSWLSATFYNTSIERIQFFDGEKWLTLQAGVIIDKLKDLLDVMLPETIEDKSVLRYDVATMKWVADSLADKQDVANMSQSVDSSTTKYPSNKAVQEADQLVHDDLDAVEGQLSVSIQAVQGNLETETNLRTEADTVLQGNIDTEAVERMDADDLLQKNIDAVLPVTAGQEGKFLRVNPDGSGELLFDVVDTSAKAGVDLDNLTPAGIQVIKDNSEFRDQNTGKPRYDWVGTLKEHTDQNVAVEHPDYVCLITDDSQGRLALNGCHYLGEVFPFPAAAGKTPGVGTFPADGSTFTADQFPSLWNDVLTAGVIETVTLEEYSNQLLVNGSCGTYGVDVANRTFRVPLMSDGTFVEAGATGTSKEAGLPNIIGNNGDLGYSLITSGTGSERNPNNAFEYKPGGNYFAREKGNDKYASTFTFDASRSSPVYGKSTTVQPKSITVRYFCQLANATVNEADMDWAKYAEGLSGKVSRNLDNLTDEGLRNAFFNADPDWSAGSVPAIVEGREYTFPFDCRLKVVSSVGINKVQLQDKSGAIGVFECVSGSGSVAVTVEKNFHKGDTVYAQSFNHIEAQGKNRNCKIYPLKTAANGY